MRIQWFISGGQPHVCVSADTRLRCQALAFEVAAELPDDVVVQPLKENGPARWSQCFTLAKVDCDKAAMAIAAGMRWACIALHSTRETPVQGIPLALIERTK